MSRSRKDGRRRGAHLQSRRLREYWSRRMRGMLTWGSDSKDATHKHERRVQAKREIESQEDTP